MTLTGNVLPTSCDFGEDTKRRSDSFFRKKDLISGKARKSGATSLSVKKMFFRGRHEKAERHLYQGKDVISGKAQKKRSDIFIRKQVVISGKARKGGATSLSGKKM